MEGALEYVEHAVALLTQRVQARADDTEVFSAGYGAQAARDFLFYFRHAHGTFPDVVRKRYGEIADEEQHGVGVLSETPQ